MKREKATEKLLRMCRTVAAGEFPVAVKAFYVFGSYARGALEPHDLDVILIHEKPSDEYLEALEAEMEAQGRFDTFASLDAFYVRMRLALRRPGERVDMVLRNSLKDVGSNILESKPILLWSPADQNFTEKIAAIKPDPTAGRFERNHLFELRRLHDTLVTMNKAVKLVESGGLTLKRIPIETIQPLLTVKEKEWLGRRSYYAGEKTSALLPYLVWWLRQHRQKIGNNCHAEYYSVSWTHRLHLGRPCLRQMIWLFRTQPKLLRQCLIPHFRKAGPNELLVFERGPNWNLSSEQD